MDVKIVKKGKEIIEVEFDEKTLPEVLLQDLIKREVEAYTYEPHPLIPKYYLHIEAKDPIDELKKSVNSVEKTWGEFRDLLKKELDISKKSQKKK